jgi:hypothetical protein
MSVKLSKYTIDLLEELLELTIPEVEFADELDGMDTLRVEALARYTWSAS